MTIKIMCGQCDKLISEHGPDIWAIIRGDRFIYCRDCALKLSKTKQESIATPECHKTGCHIPVIMCSSCLQYIRNENSQLKEHLEKSLSDCKGFASAAKSYREGMEKVYTERDKLFKENESQKSQISSLNDNGAVEGHYKPSDNMVRICCQDCYESVALTDKEYAELQKENVELTSQLYESQNQVNWLKVANKELRAHKEHLMVTKCDLLKENDDLKQMNVDNKYTDRENASLRQEKQDLIRSRDKLQKENESLKFEIASLKDDIAEGKHSKTPFKCPVCEGRGKIIENNEIYKIADYLACETCSSTGVLWS